MQGSTVAIAKLWLCLTLGHRRTMISKAKSTSVRLGSSVCCFFAEKGWGRCHKCLLLFCWKRMREVPFIWQAPWQQPNSYFDWQHLLSVATVLRTGEGWHFHTALFVCIFVSCFQFVCHNFWLGWGLWKTDGGLQLMAVRERFEKGCSHFHQHLWSE